MPIDFTFVSVMDFFFKAHKVFNLACNPKMKSFVNFFDYYIYKHNDAKRLVPQKYESVGIEVIDVANSSDNRNDAAKIDRNTNVNAG